MGGLSKIPTELSVVDKEQRPFRIGFGIDLGGSYVAFYCAWDSAKPESVHPMSVINAFYCNSWEKYGCPRNLAFYFVSL